LKQKDRHFTLTIDDISQLNPNTLTAPVFRTHQDADITMSIYQKVPILVDDRLGQQGDPWNVSFLRMFDMSSDSYLFRTRKQLEEAGFQRNGNRFVNGSERWLPLYESKMIHQYNHRNGTFSGLNDERSHILPEPHEYQFKDASFIAFPFYWVNSKEIQKKLSEKWEKKWMLSFRNIASKSLEISSTYTIIPYCGLGHSGSILFANNFHASHYCQLIANFNSIIFDYLLRQKLSGANLSYFILKQLPVIRPDRYIPADLSFIAPRVLELTYTAWDIKSFSDDVWRDADDSMKTLLRQQWEANKTATGGHEWNPPEWAEIEPDSIPLPPFKWDEERRAVLRAELDALYAKLYGLSFDELRYILDPSDVYGPEFPGETFRVLKTKEIKKFGEYRTRRLVLEAWERIENGGEGK
jgi:hypothetical protein